MSALCIDFARQPLLPIAGPFFGWQEGHSAAAGNIEHGWTARFGLVNLAMAKSLGVEGKVYAGITGGGEVAKGESKGTAWVKVGDKDATPGEYTVSVTAGKSTKEFKLTVEK